MFKVYIEESALTEPQPMEVSPDAPVARLVPALVEELQLPKTDLFGNRLVYFLRHAEDGRVLPEHFSLRTAGIADEDCLSLESYIADGASVLANPATQAAGQQAGFYADQTMIDASAFSASNNALPPLPPPQISPRRRGRPWSRRALLLAGGVTLGLAGIGVAYAGVRALTGNQGNGPRTGATMPAQNAPTTQSTATSQTFVPAHIQQQLVFKQHRQTVRAVAWSPDGKLLVSGGNDQQVLAWNLNGQVQVNQGQRAQVRALAWSPDNQQIAAAVATRVLFLNAQNGMVQGQPMDGHNGIVTALAWSSQAPHSLVSAGQDKLAVVWNTQTFQPITTFRQHTTRILAASWAADGQTVGTSSMGGVIRVWNATSGQETHGFYLAQNQAGNAVELDALAFQPGGNVLAAGGVDGVVRLWQNGLICQTMGQGGAQGQCMDMPQHLNTRGQPLRALAWSPDGRFLATGGDDNTLRIWYPTQSQAPLVTMRQDAPILALSWSPDGKMIATASGRTVTLWMLS